jgi:PEP-utilising enzyme, PEP-binding domain
VPIDVCLGAERISRSKIIKQADVVALSALLWGKWPLAVHEANFRYYEPRTALGSSAICGKAPADYPETARFLVEIGVDSISVNPASVMRTIAVLSEAEAGRGEPRV